MPALKRLQICLQIDLMICCVVMLLLIDYSDFHHVHLELFASTLAFPLWFWFYLCPASLSYFLLCIVSIFVTHKHTEGAEGRKNTLSAVKFSRCLRLNYRSQRGKKKEGLDGKWRRMRKAADRRKRLYGKTLNYELWSKTWLPVDNRM